MTYNLQLTTIDAHHHFWLYDPARHEWITEEMSAIRKDFLPKDFESILKQKGINGSVLVQVDQTEAENEFQLKNAEENDFVKGIVGWVDLQATNVEERLEFYSQYKKMKGFRHILQGEPDRALMLKSAFKNGISKLKKF